MLIIRVGFLPGRKVFLSMGRNGFYREENLSSQKKLSKNSQEIQ